MTIDKKLVCRLGVQAIDDEHLHLVDMANRISGDLDEGSYALCVSLFDEFLEAAETHFRTEEGLLERLGYPHLAQHVAYHDELVAKVKKLKLLGYEKSSKASILQHYEKMAAFVMDDIIRGDLELLPYLGGSGSATRRR